MGKVLYKIAAELLHYASNQFSCHTCNDYEISNTKENMAFIKTFEDEINISDNGEKIYLSDWIVMEACANELEKMAKL
jgi:hypothetical protein